MKNVPTSAIRILSLVILLSTFIAVSGIAATADTLLHENRADVCCDIDDREQSDGARPCSTPDCACPSCMSAAVLTDSAYIIYRLLPVESHLAAPRRCSLQDYIVVIEYPPETA